MTYFIQIRKDGTIKEALKNEDVSEKDWIVKSESYPTLEQAENECRRMIEARIIEPNHIRVSGVMTSFKAKMVVDEVHHVEPKKVK